MTIAQLLAHRRLAAQRTRVPRRRWIRIALPLYALALVAATHYPHVTIPGEIPDSDKIVHFVAYFVLAILVWQWLEAGAKPLSAATVWITAVALMGIGAVDEYTQQFVGRTTDVVDWVADAAGISCALIAQEARRRTALRRASSGPS
jgi:VanZ family protein